MKIEVNGQSADPKEAFRAAAQILSKATLPLVAGLGTDIAGAKAALALAKEAGGVVDHLSSDSLSDEMRLLAYTGGFYTTVGEARNRADMILVIGSLPLVRQPDLMKRVFPTGERLPHPGPDERSLILLGGRSEHVPAGVAVSQIEGATADISTMISCLSAYAKGKPVNAGSLGDPLADQLAAAGEKLKAAKFTVVIYSPAELDEPAIHAVRDMVVDLNAENRASSIAIQGRDNVAGVNQVCGWTTGFPLRTSFARGVAEHDPYLFETNRLLASNEADAIVWVSSLTKSAPPSTADGIPQIVICLPGTQLTKTPDILIEVGQPGEDHDAALYRPEYSSIVATKAKDGGSTGCLSVADALSQISEQLTKSEDR